MDTMGPEVPEQLIQKGRKRQVGGACGASANDISKPVLKIKGGGELCNAKVDWYEIFISHCSCMRLQTLRYCSLQALHMINDLNTTWCVFTVFKDHHYCIIIMNYYH
jgi:hypothetical protein